MQHQNQKVSFCIALCSEYRHLCQLLNAKKSIDAALVENVFSPEALLEATKVCLHGHPTIDRYRGAIEYISRAIDNTIENGPMWTILGHCYTVTGELRKAAEAFHQALRKNEGQHNPMVWAGISAMYVKLHRMGDAAEALIKQNELATDLESKQESFIKLGEFYLSTGQLKMAQSCFGAAFDARLPHTGQTSKADELFPKADIMAIEGKEQEAKNLYDAVLAIDDNHHGALKARALIAEKNLSKEETCKLWERCCKLDEADAESFYKLGCVQKELGYLQKACDSLQRSTKMDPLNAQYWHFQSQILSECGHPKLALVAVNEALKLRRPTVDERLHLAELYQDLGHTDSSIGIYTLILHEEPDNTYAKQRISVLRSEASASEE